MPTSDSDLVQFVTRIPYSLRHRAKVHCTEHDITLSRFIVQAILDQLSERDRRHLTRTGRRSATR